MAETLGSLCDKLTIVKLKEYHTINEKRVADLQEQEQQLIAEINRFFEDAISGKIPLKQLEFASNKVYIAENNKMRDIQGDMGILFSELANVNCELWHEQEKVYEFESVPVTEKDTVVKRLAILNLERNQCIDKINRILTQLSNR